MSLYQYVAHGPLRALISIACPPAGPRGCIVSNASPPTLRAHPRRAHGTKPANDSPTRVATPTQSTRRAKPDRAHHDAISDPRECPSSSHHGGHADPAARAPHLPEIAHRARGDGRDVGSAPTFSRDPARHHNNPCSLGGRRPPARKPPRRSFDPRTLTPPCRGRFALLFHAVALVYVVRRDSRGDQLHNRFAVCSTETGTGGGGRRQRGDGSKWHPFDTQQRRKISKSGRGRVSKLFDDKIVLGSYRSGRVSTGAKAGQSDAILLSWEERFVSSCCYIRKKI